MRASSSRQRDATSAVAALVDARPSAFSPAAAAPGWRSPAARGDRAAPGAARRTARLRRPARRGRRQGAGPLRGDRAGRCCRSCPTSRFGPYGAWNPQKLWWVVVLVTGFSFAGYVANRIFGERHGTIATALIGGAYSSTAVTQSLAQRLGSDEARRRRAGRNRAGQRGHVPARHRPGRRSSRPACCSPFVADHRCRRCSSARLAGWWLYRKAPQHEGPAPPGNPIALVPALGFLAVRRRRRGRRALGRGPVRRAGHRGAAADHGQRGRRRGDRHRRRPASRTRSRRRWRRWRWAGRSSPTWRSSSGSRWPMRAAKGCRRRWRWARAWLRWRSSLVVGWLRL